MDETGHKPGTVVLTEERARELMRRAVEEKGRDYVYPTLGVARTCHYVRDGAPSCLLGHVLAGAGVPLEVLATHEGAAAVAMVADLTAHGWLSEVPDRLVGALVVAQSAQDNERTWGEALDEFERTLEWVV